MKVLIINCVYKEGSTGKIVDCLADSLRREGHSTLCCYGNGKKFYDDHSVKICTKVEHYFNVICGRIRGVQYGGLYFSNCRFKKIVETFRPDVVHVHCVNWYIINVYSMLKLLAKKRINTVITLHAEIFHTGGCAHAFDCEKWKNGCHDCSVYRKECYSYFFDRSNHSWQKIRDAIQAFHKDKLIITAVSPWLANRAKESDIMKGFQIYSVNNGLSTEVFKYRKSSIIPNSENRPIALYVAPYFNLEKGDLKGGEFVIELAQMLKNYLVVIVAGSGNCELPKLPNNVVFWGRAKDQMELAMLYAQSNVTILFSKRETFSMVTAESLCCGTPVVGFKAGGPESIALPQYSSFVEYGDIKAVIDAICDINRNVIDKSELSQQASAVYSQEAMTNKYLDVFRKFGNL